MEDCNKDLDLIVRLAKLISRRMDKDAAAVLAIVERQKQGQKIADNYCNIVDNYFTKTEGVSQQ